MFSCSRPSPTMTKRARALLQVERRELDPQLRPFVRFQAEHAADGFRGIGRVFLERPPFVLVRGGGVGGKIRHAVVQHMEAHDGDAEPFRIGLGRLAAVADEVHAGHLGQGLVQLGILFAEAVLADVRRQPSEHQVDGGRARQQRRQRAEQAGAVLPQADHVERVRPQHRRQPRHAVVHRRRQLFQQPAQAALRHGLMGHRDRRQLVDLRDRDLRLDQHGQEEVQALLLGRARRLGVLLDQHFDFSGFGSRSRGTCPGCSARRVSSPASRVSWRSAPPGPRLPVTSATETGFPAPVRAGAGRGSAGSRASSTRSGCPCRPAPIRAPGADRRRSRLPARRPARQPCCRAPGAARRAR